MKKILAILLSVVLVIGITGCGATVRDMNLTAGQSALYIKEDGAVSYAVAEKFEEDYYEKGDLKEQIEREIDEYNSSQSASVDDALSLGKLKVKKKVATLVLDFATVYDFFTYGKEMNKFGTDKFYIGSIADNTECEIKGDFVSANKKEANTAKYIKKMTDADIIIVDSQYKVQIEGTIHYISDNCDIDENGIVTTSKKAGELSYIVYNID